MKKVLVFMLSMMLLLSTVPVKHVSAATNLTVDLSSIIGPVTHLATGSLYGVIETKPSDDLIAPIHPKVLTNPAVAGYQQPWGAAIPVAQRVAHLGTKVQIRLADWFTGWYDYTNLSDWFNKITTTVNDVKASGITNVYGYEIWNEPDGTWKGQYVGQIDYSDSHVEFNVNVPTTGLYSMTVRYANGTGSDSTHYLSINGGSPETVTYANTGHWFHSGSGATLTRNVSLNAGNNTIRFSKGDIGYAELDYIDITVGSTTTRYEAENAAKNRCNVFDSGYTSSNATGNLNFNEFYSQSHIKLKQLDPTAKTIGPSFAWYTHTGMLDFLTYQKAHNTIPDIICWHQLHNEDFTANYNDYRAIEQSLGISPRPITINEYSGQAHIDDEGKPGAVAPIIAKFERLKIDSACQSYWDVPNPGRLGSLLATDTETNGGYWFYKWYADMTGNMVNTIPPNPEDMYALDAFACVDSERQYASILFGGVTDGTANVVIKNFPSFFGSSVHVRVDWTPFVDRSTIVNSTNVLLEGDYTIVNGQITLPITGLYNNDGYRIYLTPGSGGGGITRYEAESAIRNNCNVFSSSYTSNGQYVGQIDYNDSYVQFTVNVPTAGMYDMTVKFANDTGSDSTHYLSVNGGSPETITYPNTGHWFHSGSGATLKRNVSLNAGSNTIRFSKGSTGYAELDYIEIQ